MMINVWLNHNRLKGNVESKRNDEECFELPYKLISRYGKMTILDGDVLHAGGITIYGLSCHTFVANT